MIYYFSGTGNSQWAAQTLADSLHEQIAFIPDLISQTTIENDDRTLGIVFPVNGWMPPKIVRDFIKCLDGTKIDYCYCLITAGDSIGEAVRVLRHDLKKVNIRLDAAFSLLMPESYVCLPGFYTDKLEKERKKIDKAKEDLKEFADDILNRRHVEKTTKGFLPFLLTYVLGIPFNNILVTDKPFKVDASRCTHCGMCAKVCPVHNITIADTPEWHKDGVCTNCMACYHHCPVHAINYWTTKKKGQYYFGKNKQKIKNLET